jgi:hypothetical protein
MRQLFKLRFASLALAGFFLASFLFFTGFSYNEQLPQPRTNTLDKQTAPISFECSTPQKREALTNVRSSVCKNIWLPLQNICFFPIAVAAYDSQDTYYKFSKEFLNLSILRCKHHPPTYLI